MTRRIVCLFPALLLFGMHSSSMEAQEAKPLTIEQLYAHGDVIGKPPEGLTWSPDGKHLTYLDGGELMELELATAKAHVLVSRAKLASLSGADGSEKDRDHRERYKMASYLWAPDGKHLLFDANGRLWFYDLHNGTGVQVGFTEAGSGDDPKFSPSGEAVAFVKNHGLSVVRVHDEGTPATVVAAAPNKTTLNGEVDWVYEEELDVRSNYFWSPDSKKIAYLQMSEGDVPEYPIEDWIPTHAKVDNQRYPQPGDLNPDVRVGVVGANGGKTVWVKLPIKDGQDYVPRFGWVDRGTLWVETITRDHKHRNVYFADAMTGMAHSVVQIEDEKFVDDNYDVSVEGGSLVLTSWKDGHNHIYRYSYDGGNAFAGSVQLEPQLTKGDFDVDGVGTVDAAAKLVYFSSNEGNVLEQQLWQVSFDGQRKQISAGAGFHEGNFAPKGGAFVETASTRTTAPVVSVCAAEDKCKVFWETREADALHLKWPEPIEVKTKDGETLYGTLQLPEGRTDAASVPLIVNPYGGPGGPTVRNKWNNGVLFDELLAQHGFAVLHADNRGTGMRGRDFAQAAYHNFGPVQLEDQLTMVDAALAKYPQLDGKRLGWWGWSWGGTFTLYAMTHSDRFRAGVAVAPVTDWRNYDSIYTERYMSTPQDFAKGYTDFSVQNAAAHLKGRLLLVHGTGDDNVHLENSVQFIQKLIEAGIPYDLQIYPRKTHSIAGADVRTHLFTRILAQFEAYLK